MKRSIGVLCGIGLMVGAVLVRADDKVPTVKEIMTKLHKGLKSPLATLKKDLNSASPDWGHIQPLTKQFRVLGAALPKGEPDKGDAQSWAKLSKAFAADCKALDDAAQKEDQGKVKAAFGKVAGSCGACHKAHKG